MSTPHKPGKKPVDIRASRIRLEPPPPPKAEGTRAYWDPSEWESWVVVVGVVLFALALSVISIGFGAITSK